MSLTTKIVLFFMVVSFLSWWFSPYRQGKKIARIVEEHCPKELIEILMTFRTRDNKWSTKLTEDIRYRLREDFGSNQLEYATQAVEFGKAEIFIREDGESRFLYASFHGAVFVSGTFIPAVSEGKMGL